MESCRQRRKIQPSGIGHDVTPVTHNISGREHGQLKALQSERDRSSVKMKQKNEDKLDDVNINDSSEAFHVRRKLLKTSADQKSVKHDDEFKFESKHYHKQAKKIAQELGNLPVHRSSKVGRERTHRCYLCFKLFPSAEALETHKENYHLAKSERPVRVKTDTALDEWEELADNSAHGCTPHCGPSEEVMVKEEEPLELSEDFDNITIIIDESVNSHVVKPLCVACKAYTSVDFRKHSKLFRQIPDDFQSLTMKIFQQFFPCPFDPASLVEPWVLCKKCATLIDKIGDMEEKLLIDKIYDMEVKLSSLKNDVLLRVRRSSERNSDVNPNNPSSECDSREGSGTGPLSCQMEETIKGLEKNLSDIEAYMQDTCEIMEIAKPQKRPGRPRKHVKKRLIPVLMDDKCEGESMANIVQFVPHSLVKNEHESMEANLGSFSSSSTKTQKGKSSSEVGVQSNNTFDNGKLKLEPMQCDINNERSNSGSVSLDILSLTNQNNQFHDADNEPEKKDQLNSHSFSPTMILKNLNGAGETESQSETLEAEKTESLGSHEYKPQSYCETFSLENIQTSTNEKTQDLDEVADDRGQTPETIDSEVPLEGDSALRSRLENYDCEAQESNASNEEKFERLPTTLLLFEDKKTDIQKLDGPVIGLVSYL